jgi:hypothetical protein
MALNRNALSDRQVQRIRLRRRLLGEKVVRKNPGLV